MNFPYFIFAFPAKESLSSLQQQRRSNGKKNKTKKNDRDDYFLMFPFPFLSSLRRQVQFSRRAFKQQQQQQRKNDKSQQRSLII